MSVFEAYERKLAYTRELSEIMLSYLFRFREAGGGRRMDQDPQTLFMAALSLTQKVWEDDAPPMWYFASRSHVSLADFIQLEAELVKSLDWLL